MASANPIQDALDQIAVALATVAGVRRASSTPPPQISEFPFIDVYVMSGTWEPYPMRSITGLLVVNIDLHLAVKDQERAAVAMNAIQYGVVNALFLALQNSTLPALQTVNAVPVQLSVFPGGGGAGVDTVGYRFTPTIKIQAVIA